MAIGDFDGLHLGHQNVINLAKQIADDNHLPISVMTFNPHPREILGITKYSRYLAPFDKKMKLFEEFGIDYVFVVRFNLDFAKVSPEDFVSNMLYVLNIKTVVVGFDFTFGHQGLGTVDTLRETCKDSMGVEVVKPYHLDGNKVSSTYIREHLHLGKLDRVTRFLGRNYMISGQVVIGEGRGRTIGVPTANLHVAEPYVIPRHGVYVVWVWLHQVKYPGVMNIGVKPTFVDEDDQVNPTLEVHLLDFNQDIYSENIIIEFITFIRDEQKFASVKLLVEQIHHDIKKTKQILNLN